MQVSRLGIRNTDFGLAMLDKENEHLGYSLSRTAQKNPGK